MSNPRLSVLGALVLWGAWQAAGLGQGTQTPFRARADAVIVDVTVWQGDRSVTDLSADEFSLLDNGVPQAIQLDATNDIPLDVSLLLDGGGLRDNRSNMQTRAQYSAEVQDIANLLRPGDRVGVFSMTSNGGEVLPLTGVPVQVGAQPRAGLLRLVDSVAQVLMTPGVPARRHLVVVDTSGVDGASVTAPQRLPELAQQSDALVDVALLPNLYSSVVLENLLATARQTGGDGVRAADLVSVVRQILERLKHGYVITYVATNVPQPGWHRITVSVTRPGEFTVGARRGYVQH